MNKIITLAAIGALVAPLPSLAATYHYIALNGEVRDVEAASAQQALTIVNAKSDALHSGVQLDNGELKSGQYFGNTYKYVSTSGELKTITAASLDAAYLLATDRKADSGFLAVE